jgi:nicotinamidase-related amidase
MDFSPLWNDLLTATDREVIRRAGYGRPRGLDARPALVLIDPQYNYLGADRPILDQLEEWPSGVGEAAWRAVPRMARLLDAARAAGVPVVFTRQVQKDLAFDGFAAKAARNGASYLEGARGTAIVDELAPRPGELVVDKGYASAFYGTPLLSYLVKLRTDTLIVAGGTTCGCVRAFCVDAVSRSFNVGVAADAVFDRIGASHKIALLDLWMKYCDLLTAEEAARYLEKAQAAEARRDPGAPAG